MLFSCNEDGEKLRNSGLKLKKEMKEIYQFLCGGVFCAIPMWSNLQAQDKVKFNVQGDLVSSYIWRGMYQSSAAVQPTLGLSIGNFSLTAWGSVEVAGNTGHKEADLTAAYSVSGLTVSLTDYWWAGQSGIGNDNENGKNKYFHFDNHTTNHILEAGISYVLPLEKCPLTFSWYTMLWGADKKSVDENGELLCKNAYSTYAEISYPFQVGGVDLNAAVGCSPFDSPQQYKNSSFAVTNLSLKATKDMKFTDSFSLPIYTQLIWNPDREDVHFVFGLTLR